MTRPWPVSIEVPVAWGDMDALGHVNNVVFLRWFESARIACFAKADILDTMKHNGPILARQEINYQAPVFFPDMITIGIRVARIGSTSFDLTGEMVRHSDKVVVANAIAVHVWYDFDEGTKVSLDAELRGRLESLSV